MRIIKIFKRILISAAVGVVALPLLLYVLLLIPPVQQKIADLAAKEISKMTGSHISIGKLYFKPFSRIDIERVYAEDLRGDTLLYVDKLQAGFDLFSLLHDQLIINSARLDGFLVHVKKDSINGEENFRFLIDAFASKDTVGNDESKSTFSISVSSVAISKGRLRYDVADKQAVDSVFDPNHIRIDDFQASLSLRSIDLSRLNVRLNTMSFREQSGFELVNLQARISSRKEIVTIENLAVKLPHSEIIIPEIKLDYTGSDISRIIDNALFDGSLRGSIYPGDLQMFYLPLAEITDNLEFAGSVSGSLPSVRITDFSLEFGRMIQLRASASVDDYLRWEESPLSLDLKELSFDPVAAKATIRLLAGVSLPEMVEGLGKLRMKASINGSLPAMKLQAELDSDPGLIALSGNAGYEAGTGGTSLDMQINAPDYDLHTLTHDTLMGKAGARIWAKGKVNANGRIQANAELNLDHFTYNRYRYKDISAKLAYTNDSISVEALSDDPNAVFSLKGMYLMPFKGTNRGQVELHLDHISLKDLHLLPEYKISDIHASLKGNISGNSLDEYTGALQVDSFMIETEYGTVRQEGITVSLDNDESGSKNIRLKSPLAKVDVSGDFSLQTIATSFGNTLHRLVPSLIAYSEPVHEKHNTVRMQAVFENTESLSEALSLPFIIKKPGSFNLSYSDAGHVLDLSARFPLIYFGSNVIRDTDLKVNTVDDGQSLVSVFGTMRGGEDTTRVVLNTQIENDSVDLVLNAENKSIDLKGSVALGVKFAENVLRENKSPDIFMQIYPTSIFLKNQSFEIGRAFVSIIGDTYTVDNFKISHPDNGNILANGVVSRNENDSLSLDFEHLQVAPFMKMMQYRGAKIEAVVNGDLIMKNLLESPLFFSRDLTVKEIAVADKKIGDMDVLSAWSDRHQAVLLDINLHQTNNHKSQISGLAFPSKDSVFVDVDVKELELEWFEPFAGGMLQNLKGTAGASVKVAGRISKPTLGGYLYFNKASLGVAMTGVNYSISDSLHFTFEKMDFQRFVIIDDKGNEAAISGRISHDNFEKFKVDVSLQARDFLLLNNPEMKDSLFFGTLKAQANIHVTGSEKGIRIDGNIKKGTSGEFYMHIPTSQSEASRYRNIVYINTPDEIDEDGFVKKKVHSRIAPALPIKLSVGVEITPDIRMGVIINPSTNDAATVSGSGNLQFNYDMANNEMNLLGDYTIEKGKCVISLKNVIKREFAVEKGGRIIFKGDPMATTFDVTAVYTLRADLATLDQSFANELANTRVVTNCILNISGSIDEMQIEYSLKFPSSDESVQRKVNNLIFSDEIMIKEVAYLLAISSFYPPGGNQGTGPRTSIWTSLASSTLSSQLNNLLSGVLNENWSIGTSLRSNDDNFSDVEMDVNVSTTLFNDRLIVNTNLGYKNNATQQGSITGDFLVEYKLTKSGALRLKAYNVTNDEYFRTSPTRQGIGVVYKKEAKTFKALFRETINRIARLRYLNQKRSEDEKKDGEAENSQTIKQNVTVNDDEK